MVSRIEHPGAYAAATKRYILDNAYKTFKKNHEDWDALLRFISYGRLEYGYADNFVGSLAQAFDSYGKLTPKQVEAVRKMIATREQRRAEWADKQTALNSVRAHLGTVGEKITLTLTVRKVIYIDGNYGVISIFLCEDAAQNVVVYKGRSAAFDGLQQGETITVLATVAEHGVRDGVKQTIIKRPKVV